MCVQKASLPDQEELLQQTNIECQCNAMLNFMPQVHIPDATDLCKMMVTLPEHSPACILSAPCCSCLSTRTASVMTKYTADSTVKL